MAVTSRFAIQQVFDLALFDLSTNACLGIMDNLKTTTFTQEGEIVYAQGGKGNPKIVGFDHSKAARFTCESATFDNLAFGSQLGATPVPGTNTDIVITDLITVGATPTTASTLYTALGTAGSEILFLYKRNTDGSLGTPVTQQAATPTAGGKFSYVAGTKVLTLYTGDFATGDTIVAFYRATAGATTLTTSSFTDVFAKSVKLVATGLVRDICTKVDYKAQIIFYSAKMSNAFELTLTADGDPAVQSIEFEALKSCNSTKLWDLIVWETTT
jgi:hypothetical protein